MNALHEHPDPNNGGQQADQKDPNPSPLPPSTHLPRSVQASEAHGGEIRDDQLANGRDHKSGDAKDAQGSHSGHGDEENVIPHDLPKPSRMALTLLVGAFVLLLVALFLVGLIPSWFSSREAERDAEARANGAPIVNTTQPVAESSGKDITLPCDVRAYASTMLYPRANGYLKKWYFDIQSRVKEGDVLAEISTPDVDAQLNQSEAALKQNEAAVDTAQSNLKLTRQTLDMYVEAKKQNSGAITEEDFNTRVSNYDQAMSAVKQSQANVAAAQATVEQMKVMVSFEKIVAPFDGVITFRGYDVGALLNPSMTGPNQEIFQIQQTDPLRVFVSVPQTYSSSMKIGQPTYLKVSNYGDREFTGYVARSAAAIDPSTRTMQFELDFSNKDNALYPGMYGQARLPVLESRPVMTIPSSSLVFNADGTQVAVVKDGKVHFQKVAVGRDLGTQLEIIGGLSDDDVVVSNPGERLTDGVEVQVADKTGQEAKPQGEKVAEKS